MSTLINFSTFTKDNGAVKSLSEILFTTQYVNSDLAQVVDINTGVKHGKHLGFVDNIGHVATAGRGCNPTYQSATPKGYEKVWDLGDYSTPLEFCADDWKNTLVRYCLKTGTAMEDLTGTEVMEKILLPLLDKAHQDALWRMVWFADKTAKNISANGEITNGVSTTLFTMCTGLFKHLEAIVTGNASQKNTISANSQSTWASQKSAMETAGVALGILDKVLSDADSRIGANDGVLYMTNWMFNAFRHDYNEHFKETIPFENVAKGVKMAEYDGYKIVALAEWDRCIKEFQNDGTKLNNPFRVVYTPVKNLLVGTEDNAMIPDVELTFDNRTRSNLYYSASNIGTLVAEDNLVQVAW